MLHLQILETLPSTPGHHRDHVAHSRVKHEKAVVGTRGVGSLSVQPAKPRTGGTQMKAPRLKELCSVGALFKSQSGR